MPSGIKRDTLIQKYRLQFEGYVANTTCRATASRYSRALEGFFQHFTDKAEPGDFSRLDILDYRTWRRRSVSATSVNYEIQVVGRLWNWMIEHELAIYNPAGKIRKFKEVEVVKTSFGDGTQEKLYEVCLNDQERMLVGLALTTGLRENTLIQLEKSEFDFDRKIVVVPPEKTKTGRQIELPLRDEELALVKALAPETGNIWGDWGKSDRALSYRWNRICSRAGISERGLRLARRTVATTLLRHGLDVRSVQEWLGHKKITTTMKYLTPATQKESRAALDNLPKGKHGEAAIQPQGSGTDAIAVVAQT